MPNPCPTCHAQLDPGTPHTFCARTKEPKARELAMRIDDVVYSMSAVEAEMHDRLKALEKKADNLFGGGIDLATRVEALEQWQALYEDADAKHGGRSALARLEALESVWLLGVQHGISALERAANHENTGAALGDGSERQPSDSHGSPAPDKGGCGTKHGEPSTQALGELRSVEACGKVPVTVDPYKLTDAPSALPIPERPTSWARKSVDGEHYIEAGAFYAMRERCIALESRLAEAVKQVEEERQSHLGAAHAWAEAADERDRNRKRIEEITADRDALKAKLAEASKSAWPVTDLNTEEECVTVLRMFGNPQASRVADVLEGITASRDALRAKLDGVREAAEKWTLDDHAKDEYMKGRTVEDSLNAIGRAAITSALAAAENTGDAGRTPAGQCSTDRSTDGQPPTSTEPAVDEPGPVTNPAVSHPSPATAFELTDDQGNELYEAADGNYLCAHVEKLVNSELRRAREGWVTREVAERALEQCALEYISGSSVHANAKDYLTAAIRAASKEAGGG